MANNEFLELTSKKTFDDLQKVKKDLADIAKGINDANTAARGFRLPSQFGGGSQEVANLNQEISRLRQEQEELRKTIERVTAARRVSNAQTSEEIVNGRILRQNADRNALANSTLANAYQRLSAQQAQSAARVQDIIARGRTAEQTQRQYNRELRNAQSEFDRLNARVTAADRAVGRYNRNVGNYPTQAVKGVRDLVAAFGIVGGVTLFAQLSKDIFNITKQLQGMNIALQQVTGTEQALTQAQGFLNRISEDFGLNLISVTQQYTRFYTAAKDKLPLSDIQGIFESVAKAAGVMGLSVEQQEGAFRALEQMLSKGNVQAEEIRGQLGERLPGAFGILAKSMGVTETQLNKLLKDGKVLAAEVLPAFAKELERAYSIENIDRVETITAETNRLSNAWTNFVATISSNEGVLTKAFSSVLNFASRAIKGLDMLAGGLDRVNQYNADRTRERTLKSELKIYEDIAEESGKIAAQDKARSDYSFLNSELEKEIALQKALEASINETNKAINKTGESRAANWKGIGALIGLPSSVTGRSKEFTQLNRQLGTQKQQLRDNAIEQAKLNGAIEAAKTIIDADTKATNFNTDAKKKRQKADIDYLSEVYQLRKQNTENLIEEEDRIMQNEEKNYERRLAAANNYYYQKEKLLELDFNEQNRLNDLNYKNQVEAYTTAISEGKATNSNLQELEYQHVLRKEKINAEYEGKRSALTIDAQKKLNGVLEAIQDQFQRNLISKQQVDNLRQAGLILGNVSGQTTTKQFAEIENRMRKLSNQEQEDQIKLLEIDLRRTQTEKYRIAYREKINLSNEEEWQTNQAIVNLTDKELKLQNQITSARNAQKQAIFDLTKEMKAATSEYLSGFTNGIFGDLGVEALGGLFDQVTYQVVNDLGEIETKAGSTFDKLIDQAGTLQEKFAIAFNTTLEVAQQFYNSLQKFSQQRFDREYADAERSYKIATQFYGQTEEARAELERQYEEKRREIRRKELQAAKEQAIFNAVINTAQGVTAALGQANYALAIIIGALGAAQIALIASQEIPAYAQGTDNHKGGLAVVGDGGRREIIETPGGGLYRTPSVDTLVDMPKGSKVYKSEADFLRNSGALFSSHAVDYNGGRMPTANEIASALGEEIRNMPTSVTNFNKSGIKTFIRKGHSMHQKFNNKVTQRGISIK